jgi:hypothetical protein
MQMITFSKNVQTAQSTFCIKSYTRLQYNEVMHLNVSKNYVSHVVVAGSGYVCLNSISLQTAYRCEIRKLGAIKSPPHKFNIKLLFMIYKAVCFDHLGGCEDGF